MLLKDGIAEYKGVAEEIDVGRVMVDAIKIVQGVGELESAFPNNNKGFRKPRVQIDR